MENIFDEKVWSQIFCDLNSGKNVTYEQKSLVQ